MPWLASTGEPLMCAARAPGLAWLATSGWTRLASDRYAASIVATLAERDTSSSAHRSNVGMDSRDTGRQCQVLTGPPSVSRRHHNRLVQSTNLGRSSGPADRRLELGVLAGVAAAIAPWVLSVIVIVGWPGYDPVRQSISLLATAPLGWLMTAALAIGGLLDVAWALALPAVLGAPDRPRDRTLVRALLLLQAAIALGFAILPTDPEGVPVSTVGFLHLLDFYLYAVSMPVTLLVLGFVMRRDPRWHGSASPTRIAALLAIASIALVPATIDGPLMPWLGLLERLFVAIPSVWQLGVALVAWRLVRSGQALERSSAAWPCR
jgi:Protein of unknown function (DUF998)